MMENGDGVNSGCRPLIEGNGEDENACLIQLCAETNSSADTSFTRNSMDLSSYVLQHLVQQSLGRLNVDALCAANPGLNQAEQDYVSFRTFVMTNLFAEDLDRRSLVRHAFSFTYLVLLRAGLRERAGTFFRTHCSELSESDLEVFELTAGSLDDRSFTLDGVEYKPVTCFIPWQFSLPMCVAQQLRAYFSFSNQFPLFQSITYCCLGVRPVSSVVGCESLENDCSYAAGRCASNDADPAHATSEVSHLPMASDPSPVVPDVSVASSRKEPCSRRTGNGYHLASIPLSALRCQCSNGYDHAVEHTNGVACAAAEVQIAACHLCLSQQKNSSHPSTCCQHAHTRPPPPAKPSSNGLSDTPPNASPTSTAMPINGEACRPPDRSVYATTNGSCSDVPSHDTCDLAESNDVGSSYDAFAFLERATEIFLPSPSSLSFAMQTVDTQSDFRICSMALSPAGCQMAMGCDDSQIRVTSVALPERDAVEEARHHLPTCASPTASSDTFVLRGHTGMVCSSHFCPDKDLLSSSSSDGVVRLWDVVRKEQVAVSPQLTGRMWDVTSPEDLNGPALLLSSSSSGTAHLWHIDGGSSSLSQLRCFVGHSSDINVSRFHPNCAYIATGSSDGVLLCHDLVAGKAVRTMLAAPRSSITALTFSPCGNYIVSASELGVLSVFDIGSGRLLTTVSSAHSSIVLSLSFPCPSTVLSTGMDGDLCVWDFSQLITFSGGSSLLPTGGCLGKRRVVSAQSDDSPLFARVPCGAVTPLTTRYLSDNVVAIGGVSKVTA